MKTHLTQIRHTARLMLAVLASAVAASVSAQTVITPDLKAPPSAYDTSKPGMVLKGHQIAGVRSPGDQNSIANVLKELSGGFGPSLSGATNGPLTGGLWSEVYLNHTTDWPLGPADGDWVYFGDALPFPGVNSDTTQTGGFSTFAYDIITYLDLPAGTNTLVVGSGDSFRLTIGVGDNPYSFAAVQAGQFSGSRNYGPSVIDLDVQSAGVYPVRIIYGQGGGINGLQFYSINGDTGARFLINDPNGGGMQLKAYQPASLPITPSLAYASKLLPAPGDQGASPMPIVQAQLTDGTTTTVTNVSTLTFDGVPVSPTIAKTGAVTYVTYNVPNLLPNQSVHTNVVVAQDSAGNVLSNQWTFTVGSFQVIPASWAYPAGSGDATQRGFAGRVHQTRDAANGSYTIRYGNAQIEGQLIDGATGLPYVNTVVTNGDPVISLGWPGTQPADAGGGPGDARTFTVTNVVNYSILDGSGAVMDTGNFNSVNGYPDALFPGLPGSIDDTFTSYSNSGEIAVELVAFVELAAGLQQIGVNCNDGFQLAISPNDARDIWSYVVRSGRQALWVTSGTTASGGDVPLINRLATKYGLDVQVVAQSSLAADINNGLPLTTGKVLIAVSSQVSGGTVAPWARACISSNITVPVITWEYANADDWAFTEGSAGGAQGFTQVLIANGPGPLQAGFTNDQVVTTHTSPSGGGNCPAAPGTIMAAYTAAGTGNPVLVGVEKGLVVNSTVFPEAVTHASRKVFFGVVNNDSGSGLTADGFKLFDAAIEWLAPAPPAPPRLTATAGPGSGQMTLSWTSSGTLETSTNLAAPVWISAPSQANPQTVNTTDPQRYYRLKQ